MWFPCTAQDKLGKAAQHRALGYIFERKGTYSLSQYCVLTQTHKTPHSSSVVLLAQATCWSCQTVYGRLLAVFPLFLLLRRPRGAVVGKAHLEVHFTLVEHKGLEEVLSRLL